MSQATANSFMEPQVQRWVEALLPWVENDLRFPVDIQDRKGYWRVEILGTLRIDLNHDHCGFTIAARQQDGFVINTRADLRLLTMLTSVDWLKSWIWRRAHRCPVEMAGLPRLIPMIAHELRALIPDQAIFAARKAIRSALPLDTDILALARRAHPLPILGLRHYAATARFREQMLERERLSPALLPVFQSHEGFRLLGYRADCGQVKVHLRGCCLTEGGWRMLLRHGSNLWKPLRRSHEFCRHPDRVLCGWANIVANLPRKDELPPNRIALAWAQTCSMRHMHPDFDARQQARLVAAAWRRWDAIGTREERRRWARQELVPVMAWSQTRSHQPPAAPANSRFAWYLRQQRAASAEAVARQISKHRPGEPDRVFHFKGLCFTRLGSRASLYRAGLHFHNCLVHVPDNNSKCISPGSYYVVSEEASGKALALLRADATVTGTPGDVLELRGPFNRRVSMQLAHRIWEFVHSIQSAPQADSSGASREETTGPTSRDPFEVLQEMGIPCTDELADAALLANKVLKARGMEPNEKLKRVVTQLNCLHGLFP